MRWPLLYHSHSSWAIRFVLPSFHPNSVFSFFFHFPCFDSRRFQHKKQAMSSGRGQGYIIIQVIKKDSLKGIHSTKVIHHQLHNNNQHHLWLIYKIKFKHKLSQETVLQIKQYRLQILYKKEIFIIQLKRLQLKLLVKKKNKKKVCKKRRIWGILN